MESPLSGVSSSGRVWRKVRESDAGSVSLRQNSGLQLQSLLLSLSLVQWDLVSAPGATGGCLK